MDFPMLCYLSFTPERFIECAVQNAAKRKVTTSILYTLGLDKVRVFKNTGKTLGLQKTIISTHKALGSVEARSNQEVNPMSTKYKD